LVEAATGRTNDAKLHVEQARSTTRCLEVATLGTLTELITRMAAAPHRLTPAIVADAVQTFEAAYADAVLDPVVMAYRAYPPLLRTLASDHKAAHLLRELCLRANDRQLALEAGIPPALTESIKPGLLTILTRREREVLTSMSMGLSNAEIASQLVITVSTVKVHVRNILRKLGVRTRLQAILLAREALESPDNPTDNVDTPPKPITP
jgi:ATP/maltotriose-dependent transcriptional regulator MalT